MISSPLRSARPLYYGHYIVIAGFITQFIAVGMSNYIVSVFQVPMTEEFGWSRGDFSFSRTIGQMVMAFTGFLIGSHIDRYGGRPFMLVGSLILAASLYALSAVQTLLQWNLLNGLAVTAGAAMIGNLVVNVTLGKWFVEHRGLAVALAGMGVSFAGLVLPPLATWLVDSFGWREAWQYLGLSAAALALPMGLVVRRTPEDFGLHPDGKSDQDIRDGKGAAAAADYDLSMTRAQAMRTLNFYKLVLAFGLFQISITVMLLHGNALMTDAGYSRILAASMISLASLPAFVSKPYWGYLIGKQNAAVLAAIGAVTTGAAVMMIVFSLMAKIDYLVYAGFLLMGIGWGGLLPLQEVIWASFFGRRYLGSVRSTAMPFSFTLSAIGPWVVGSYYDMFGNYNSALLIIAGCNLASGVMLYRIRNAHKSRILVASPLA